MGATFTLCNDHAFTRAAKAGERHTLVDSDDGFVRFDPPLRATLGTDAEVLERDYVRGRHYRALRFTKALIGRWQKSGTLDADGSLRMLGDHGRGYPDSGDVLGKWEDLQVEQRGEVKHFTAIPAFDPASMNAWFRRMGYGDGDWRGVIERGTLSRTSVGYSASELHEQKHTRDGLKVFHVRDFDLPEASIVWQGLDKQAGIGRSETAMDPEQIAALIKSTVEQTVQSTLAEAARAAEAAKPAPAAVPDPAPPPPPAPVDELRSARWGELCKQAAVAFPDSAKLVEVLDTAKSAPDGQRCQTLADAVLSEMTARTHANRDKPMNNARMEGGEPNSLVAMDDTMAIIGARVAQYHCADTASETQKKRNEQAFARADKGVSDWREMEVSAQLMRYARAAGIVPVTYEQRNPRLLADDLRHMWKRPDGAVRDENNCWWIPREGAVYTANGRLDVLKTLRSAPGGIIPADLESLTLAATFLSFTMPYDGQIIPMDRLMVMEPRDTLDVTTMVTHDMIVPDEVVTGDQTLPQAYLFDKRQESSAELRGARIAINIESLMSSYGAGFMQVSALFGRAWAEAKNRRFFDTLIAGLYAQYVSQTPSSVFTGGAPRATTFATVREWLKHLYIQPALERPVPRPGTIPNNLKNRLAGDTMTPDVMIHGRQLEELFADYFAARENHRAPATGGIDQAHARFERKFASEEARVSTDAITADGTDNASRQAFAFRAAGSYATMRGGSVRGYEMRMTMRMVDGENTQWERMQLRILDTHEQHIAQPQTLYRNQFPA